MSDLQNTAGTILNISKLDKVLYTPRVHTTGGREDGTSWIDGARLQITLSTSGTSDTRTNPEQLFGGCLVSLLRLDDRGDFRADNAEAIVEKGHADLIACVRHFPANPDSPRPIRLVLPLKLYDQQTFCTFDFHGYTDDPFYGDLAAVPVHNSQKGESQCRTS